MTARALANPRTPASIAITPRRLSLDSERELPRYWVADDPFLTHFMNALSITFPPGERMFMDAVREVRERVTDPRTKQDISAFLAQEALHSRAHGQLNGHLRRQGYPVDRLEGEVKALLDRLRRRRGSLGYLSVTCALEHVTAMLGHRLLSRADLREVLHEELRPLWLWHALEETEHKGVAFDVYREVYGSYLPRASAMLGATAGLFVMVPYIQLTLLAHDGLAYDGRVWLTGMKRLWGQGGFLRGLLPVWLAYFRPSFHPWQHDNSALIAAWERTLALGGVS